MKELSTAAQAIVNAAIEQDYGQATPVLLRRLAGALRATADQLVPEDYCCFTGSTEWDQGSETRNDSIRESILAVVTELEITAKKN